MDIETLKALGVSPEDLADRIVDQAVNALLSYSGFGPDGDEEEVRYETKFKREIEKRVQASVDAKIAALAAEHVLPRVGEMIEQADMRKTNGYGEAKSPPMTFKEYIAYRAEVYMTEDVDYHGNSKADLETQNKSTYDWRNCGPRLTVLMRSYIRDTLEKQAKAAVTDVNQVIAKNLAKAAQDAITAATANLKVTVAA
jgi:LPS O-antigen subunit length determinant protein (WzzB/FepE family)